MGTEVYKVKFRQYLLRVHNLENEKRKLNRMLSVSSARFVRRWRSGHLDQNKGVARHDKAKIMRKIYVLRSREIKLYARVKKDTGRYANRMTVLNNRMRVVARIQRRMLHKLGWTMKKSKMELLRMSNRLNIQMKLERGLVDHARHASRLQKVGLAKEAETDHRTRMQEASQLRRIMRSVKGEVHVNYGGVPRKPSNERTHLKRLMIVVTNAAKKFAKQRVMMARQLLKEARHAARESVRSIKKEALWRRQLTAVARWKSNEAHNRRGREAHLRNGEKKFEHIMQELRAKIKGERDVYAQRSKALLVKRKILERVKGKTLQQARRFRVHEGLHWREVKYLRLRMQEIARRLLKAHVRVKGALSLLKAEKIKGEARLTRAINRAKKERAVEHVRALWASRLDKYKNERAKLYEKMIQRSVVLAKKVKIGRKRFANGQRLLAAGVQEARKTHVLKAVREKLKQYSAYLREKKIEISRINGQNEVLIRRLKKEKSKTSTEMKRQRESHTTKAEILQEKKTAFRKQFERDERDIALLKRIKKRLLRRMAREIIKSEKYAAQARNSRRNFRNKAIHRRELSQTLRAKNSLWEMARQTKEQRMKTIEVRGRAALLRKRKVESTALLKRVQKKRMSAVTESRRM